MVNRFVNTLPAMPKISITMVFFGCSKLSKVAKKVETPKQVSPTFLKKIGVGFQ